MSKHLIYVKKKKNGNEKKNEKKKKRKKEICKDIQQRQIKKQLVSFLSLFLK